jgi:CubicO group peptidase (beta-lactamase class C family)
MTSSADVAGMIESTLSHELNDTIQHLVDHFRQQHRIPSIQLSTIAPGLALHCSTGIADLETGTECTLDHAYYLGSISKLYAQSLIFILAAQGKLDLSEKVGAYLGGFRHGQDVTVANLLRHTGGVYDVVFSRKYKEDTLHRGILWTVDEILAELNRRELAFLPGTQYSYSNAGYIVLERVVESVTQTTFYEALKKNLLIPLGLTSVYYDPVRTAPTVTTGYDADYYAREDTGAPINITKHKRHVLASNYSSGGIAASAAHTCRLAHVMFTGGILSESATRTFTSCYGVTDVDGVALREHAGYLPGYKGYLGHSRRLRTSIVALSNYSNSFDTVLQGGLISSVLDVLCRNDAISAAASV